MLFFSLIFLFSLLGSVSAECAGGVTVGNNISQYGITWFFDKPYECGTFVNGDYWVKIDSVTGIVNVIGVDPAPYEVSGSLRSGSMANPMPGKQSFDQRAGSWASSERIDFPFILNPGVSLVSSESWPEGAARPTASYLKSAVVLTCLAEVPPVDSFRPAYVGDTKTIYIESQTNFELPNLPSVVSTPEANIILPTINRVWLDHLNQTGGIYIFPVDNMANYGRELSNDVQEAACFLLLDKDASDKSTVRNALIQNGIDHYWILKNGGAWPQDGGHASGRKFPILFAGLMLGESNMKNIGKLYFPEQNLFGEDSQTFYVSQSDIDLEHNIQKITITEFGPDYFIVGSIPSYTNLRGNYIEIIDGVGAGQIRYIEADDAKWAGLIPPFRANLSESWNTIPVVGASTFYIRAYENEHKGLPEYGGAHVQYPERDNPSWIGPYRQGSTTSSWNGWLLASLVLDIKDEWNNSALFDYQDRYMWALSEEGPYPDSDRSWSDFSEEMWDTYRANYGCGWFPDDGTNAYSNGHYDCDGELVKCSWQASTCSTCTLVDSCDDYPNQRASDYDPCGLGCEETPPTQCVLTRAYWQIV